MTNNNTKPISLSHTLRPCNIFVTSLETYMVEFGLKQSLEFCNKSVNVSSVKLLTHSFHLLFNCRVIAFWIYPYIIVYIWLHLIHLSFYSCYPPHIIWVVISRRMIWAQHVDCLGGSTAVCGIFVGKSERKTQLWIYRCRWEDIINMGLIFVRRSWTKFIRRRIGTLAEYFGRGNEHLGSTQYEKFLEQLRNC
jgi:hypothetical protein